MSRRSAASLRAAGARSARGPSPEANRRRRVEAGLALAALVLLTGCPIQWPVSPLVRFTAFGIPYRTQDDFKSRFNTWKAGKSQPWSVRMRATALSESSIIINSDEASSLGPKLAGGTNPGNTFTPTKAELSKLIDDLLVTKVFDLYDGHYGAYDQGGGLIGPDLVVTIGGIEKHVSYDESLPASVSWEAGAIKGATDAVRALGLKYIKR